MAHNYLTALHYSSNKIQQNEINKTINKAGETTVFIFIIIICSLLFIFFFWSRFPFFSGVILFFFFFNTKNKKKNSCVFIHPLEHASALCFPFIHRHLIYMQAGRFFFLLFHFQDYIFFIFHKNAMQKQKAMKLIFFFFCGLVLKKKKKKNRCGQFPAPSDPLWATKLVVELPWLVFFSFRLSLREFQTKLKKIKKNDN